MNAASGLAKTVTLMMRASSIKLFQALFVNVAPHPVSPEYMQAPPCHFVDVSPSSLTLSPHLA